MQDVNEWNDRVREPDPGYFKSREKLEHRPSDSELEEAVMAAIRAARLGIEGLSVRVVDGEAAMLGLAETEADRMDAEDVALGVPGIEGVINELDVKAS